MPVRLFVGNLPYSATEADLRTHFSAVAPPSHVSLPVDRATGRPRGFAFVEFIEREQAEQAISRFHGQVFQGRPLSVSEARAREDRPPGGRPFSGPPPWASRAEPGAAPAGDRGERPQRVFGPDAKKARRGTGRPGQKQERGPKGPIRERNTGRVYSVDSVDDEPDVDVDEALPDFATSAPSNGEDIESDEEEERD